MFVIREVRESFKAPVFPVESDFNFGPQWSLAGIDVGGERILFETALSNLSQVTAGVEAGSCPILYVWDIDGARWISHGKVIHQARTRALEGSETVVFNGLVHHFRLAEGRARTCHDQWVA